MKKLLFPVIVLTIILLMAAAVSTSAVEIWTIGFIDDSYSELGTVFPVDIATYDIGDDPVYFPAGLYIDGYGGSNVSKGVHEVTINFSLDYAYSNVSMEYARFGAETDNVTLDGGVPIPLSGPGEGKWVNHTVDLGILCAGAHSVVIECVGTGGADGWHWIDGLLLTGNLIEPIVTTDRSGPDTAYVGELTSWTITIEICPDGVVNLDDVVVQGGIGADLDVTSAIPEQGTVTQERKGKKEKGATIVRWDVGTLVSNGCLNLVLTVQTGLNPKEKQEFTSVELGHELDGGFSATFWYCDTEFSTLETDPLTVDVIPAP